MEPIVWVTSFFMFAFHIGAIAALFFFNWKAFLDFDGSKVDCRRRRYRNGLSPPPDASRFQDAKVDGICVDHARDTEALEGGPIFWVAIHQMHHQEYG